MDSAQTVRNNGRTMKLGEGTSISAFASFTGTDVCTMGVTQEPTLYDECLDDVLKSRRDLRQNLDCLVLREDRSIFSVEE